MGPDVIVAGMPKAGTTALWAAMARHPSVFIPEHKEPGYFAFAGTDARPKAGPFDPDYFDRIVTDPGDYARLFAGAGARLGLDASPVYALDPTAPVRIAAEVPDAKVLLILRDPVRRAFSQFAHHVRDGLETTADFGEALAREGDRLANGWSPFFGYAAGGRYRRIISRFEAAVPEDRLCVLFHEDMEDDPAATLARVAAFLGLDAGPEGALDERHNLASAQANAARFPGLRRMLSHPGKATRVVSRLLPKAGRRRVKATLERINAGRRPVLDTYVARQLARSLEEDIAWVEQRFDRDLAHWRHDQVAAA
ncbi:sulfotransferase family protein [Tropicimonas isoalkanivorans]|uniref:Sulfotransferase family protein n=1 Tax=Tropicimonas isoalkanivorans TaxID=441112 RepID=A0A1I1GD89_9RHOB|nr:sulfotransferase [Tropicimonas isoalkanivorans]SFC09541.1 Sulfotransferase family protein [Tropicimonas isoalkanivorans]